MKRIVNTLKMTLFRLKITLLKNNVVIGYLIWLIRLWKMHYLLIKVVKILVKL